MRIVSDKYTAIGGRIGSLVGTMNRAGMCFRNWVVPANPKTAHQLAVRSTLKNLALAWSDTLTQEQRDAWNAYAATLEFTSKLGTKYTISGFGAYVQGNGARQVGSLSRIDNGPTTPGLDTFTDVTVTFDGGDDTITVAFTNTDAWAGEVGGALLVRRSPLGFKEGVSFYEGPFRYAGKQLGAATPPTSPLVIDLGTTGITPGLQYAIAVRSVRADGRCSEERIFRAVASA